MWIRGLTYESITFTDGIIKPSKEDFEEKINVFLAGRNLKNVEIVSPLGVNPHNLMRYDNVIIDSKVIDKVQGMASWMMKGWWT